jgi:hypothetical protein
MAWEQTDIDALETAIKQGVRTVSYADRTVTYHSLDEMLRLRSVMQNAVDAASGSAGVSCTFAKFEKG